MFLIYSFNLCITEIRITTEHKNSIYNSKNIKKMNLLHLHIELLRQPSPRFSFDSEQDFDCLIWDALMT